MSSTPTEDKALRLLVGARTIIKRLAARQDIDAMRWLDQCNAFEDSLGTNQPSEADTCPHTKKCFCIDTASRMAWIHCLDCRELVRSVPLADDHEMPLNQKGNPTTSDTSPEATLVVELQDSLNASLHRHIEKIDRLTDVVKLCEFASTEIARGRGNNRKFALALADAIVQVAAGNVSYTRARALIANHQ